MPDVSQKPVNGPDQHQAAQVEDTDMSRLVRVLAGRVLAGLPRGSGVDLSDLMQAGNVGWIQAVRSFRPQHGTPLAGYAKFRIRGEMLDTVRRNSRCFPVSQVSRTPMGEEDSEWSLEELLPACADTSPLRMLASVERRRILAQEVRRLPERFQMVVRLRYGSGYNLRQIGDVLCVKESRACQIHRSALGRLKRALMLRPGARFTVLP